jgi:hypothetical protein
MGLAIGRLSEFLRELGGSIEQAKFYSMKIRSYDRAFEVERMLIKGSLGLPDASMTYFDLC